MSENARSFELDRSPSKLSFNESFHFKPDYESPLPTYQDLQSYLEDALRKQISLQFLLGMHKLHDLFQQKSRFEHSSRVFFSLLSKKPASSPSGNVQKEVTVLKEHLVEELQLLKTKQKELEIAREEISIQPWVCLKDPSRLYERMVEKQDELWSHFQQNRENVDFAPPQQEKLWGFLSQNSIETAVYRETVYHYQEFLMQEHVKLDLFRQKLSEESEKLRREQDSVGRLKMSQLDYELFEETREKIKEELGNERKVLEIDKRRTFLLLRVARNYLNVVENRPMDWESSIDEFVREMLGRIESGADVFEKDQRKKQSLKRLREECERLLKWEGGEEEPFERIAGVLGNISSRKEGSQEEEIQRKLWRRKEEMLQHKQKELEALKKLLEKESLILQEEKAWLVNEKAKLAETTKKKIDLLKEENQKLRDENQLFKEQNPLQNISNIVPSNSTKTMLKPPLARPESSIQFRPYDEFQVTEQFIANPQIRRTALFTLANWIDLSFEINGSKPLISKTLGFYKWRLFSMIRALPATQENSQIEENPFLKRKWLQYQQNLISQRRYPYGSLNKQRKALEDSFFDFERRKFFKNRFVQLFGSIFRHRRRKEKLIFVVGFYKFCLNSLLHNSRSQRSISEKLAFHIPVDEKKTFASANTSHYIAESPNEIKERTKKALVNQGKKTYDSVKESQRQAAIVEEVRSERVFAVPLVHEIPVKERSERTGFSLESHIQRTPISPEFEEIPSRSVKARGSSNRMKAACRICCFLMRDSGLDRKAKAWIRWLRFDSAKEREFMNAEFNDINILLGEMVCRENQRILTLRLRKNDMDSRISLLNQMLTCLKVNIFQKNLKKIKGG